MRYRTKTYVGFCALLASVVLGCGPTKAPAQNAGPPPSGLVAPEIPTLIAPGVVSTTRGEYSPTLALRRNELYFMRRTPDRFDYTIYVSRYDGNRWSLPQVVPFSGQYRDAGPYLDPTGEHLFFDSRRPAAGLDEDSINLWRVRRDSLGWSSPQLLRGPSENAQPVDRVGADEFGPAVDATGTLYFYSFRPPFRGGARYRLRGDAYREVQIDKSIPDPSASTFVSYLYVSPDGTTAIMDGRAAGRRDGDMFFSCRQADATWSAPRPLPLINTTASEGGGWMTADGSLLLFSSNRAADDPRSDAANLYMVSTSSLPVPCTD